MSNAETSTIVTVADTQLRYTCKYDDIRGKVETYSDGNYTLMSDDFGIRISKNDISSWNPDIYTLPSFSKNQELTIQTTSYGALSSKDIDKVTVGFQNAQRALNWISDLI